MTKDERKQQKKDEDNREKHINPQNEINFYTHNFFSGSGVVGGSWISVTYIPKAPFFFLVDEFAQQNKTKGDKTQKKANKVYAVSS